ncbi:MAG: hypothetical protein JWN13_4507, partial [Betaproteobacteria bacterium]|nr:hypothetical protein [Betaproteobacteria bacterium]
AAAAKLASLVFIVTSPDFQQRLLSGRNSTEERFAMLYGSFDLWNGCPHLRGSAGGACRHTIAAYLHIAE